MSGTSKSNQMRLAEALLQLVSTRGSVPSPLEGEGEGEGEGVTMQLVLGIDLGTTYFKLGLFDRNGNLCGLGRSSVQADTGDGTICELPTDRFWSALHEGLSQACGQAGCSPSDIVAAAYSSQANSFLLLDHNDAPLTPLLLWPDTRATPVDQSVIDLWQRRDFVETTGIGIPVCPELAIAKLRWFMANQRDLWDRTARIMTISDYLVYGLTGKYNGDAGTSSLLGMRSLRDDEWWQDAMDALSVPEARLSDPLRPGSQCGYTTEAASRIGLPEGIPLAVGSLDHHMAALGAGAGTVAPISESTGTVLATLRCTDQYHPCTGICMGPGVEVGHYYQLVFDSNGAAVLEWYQKGFASDLTFAQLDNLAAAVASGCEGLLASPLSHQQTDLSGFDGRKDGHTHGHFARAIMESVAGTLASLVDTLSPNSKPERIVSTGGAAKSDVWMQIKADTLGIEFVRTTCQEPACLGAAILAAAVCDWFPSPEECASEWIHVDRTFTPTM